MWTQGIRRAAIVIVIVGMLAGCKKDKPTGPPDDDEPDPTADVR
jgi:hypothetical protein